jgi:nucleoside-diphosphate-sugar epimerase
VNKTLLTGGTGCIGAATAYVLASRGARTDQCGEVLIATSSGAPGFLGLWFGPQLDGRIKLVKADVADEAQIRQLVVEYQPTRIIHLGAFQSPDCEAHPIRGMEINVGGTLNMLNAAAELKGRLERFVFASSGAVYGPRSFYPGAAIHESDALAPPNLYGAWKVAGEHLARLFHDRTGVATVCLRLNTTYGKGRDKGRTSAPTTAMKAVALGSVEGRKVPFRMPYFRRENYHYVGDVAAHFASCALDPFDGFAVFNIRGETMEVDQFLGLIENVAGELGMGDAVDLGIAQDANPAIFSCDLDDRAIQSAFPGVERTPLREGIRKTLEDFRELAASGKLAL